MKKLNKIQYPIIAVNDALTKHMFDNRYGTAQSVIDGLLRSTGLSISGKRIVVCGYGWVGQGIASRLKGLGAIVMVTEINPIRAIQALMDGYIVDKIDELVPFTDIFITCTGQTKVITENHFSKMKNGAILANAGHFDVEIDARVLYERDPNPETTRENIECFRINNSKLYLIAKGRVVNLVCGEGNPPEIMSLSFANQLLSIIHLSQNYKNLDKKIYPVPEDIDTRIAKYWLESVGIKIDKLTEEQKNYGFVE